MRDHIIREAEEKTQRGQQADGQTIDVLVVDDHAIVRKGVRALLDTVPDIRVVGEAQNGYEAIEEAERLRPDVILMDLVMPEMDGVDAIRYIAAHQPETRILVLTSFNSDGKVFPAIKAGALGYLLKDSGPEELVTGIRQVFHGEPSLHPTIAYKLLKGLTHPWQGPRIDSLTQREMEVLQLVALGCCNQAIADRLAISEATVRAHVSNILTKLCISSRTQAALYALREGLVSLDEVSEHMQI